MLHPTSVNNTPRTPSARPAPVPKTPPPKGTHPWKVHPYWTKQSQALEQDNAAGGREHRVMRNCGALGRVVLQHRNLRLYAELRWQVNKKQLSRYLCEVTADTRAANLAAGWQLAHDRGLTTPSSAATSESVRT
jgi:hypothetical protein